MNKNIKIVKVDKQTFKKFSKSKAYDKIYEPVVDIADNQFNRINEYKEELADVEKELANERCINNRIKAEADKARAEADKARADADKARADADKQSNRLDNLEARVNKLDDGLSELYERQEYLESEIKSIDDETSVLDSKNRGISNDLAILRNNDFSELDTDTLIKVGETQLTVNCKRISFNNSRRHNLADELRGLEVRINNTKAENYAIIKDMVLSG